jgi:hypothetical protein
MPMGAEFKKTLLIKISVSYRFSQKIFPDRSGRIAKFCQKKYQFSAIIGKFDDIRGSLM